MKRLIILAVSLFTLLMPATALAAFNPLGSACGVSGASGSAACTPTTGDPIAGPNGVLKKVSLIVASIAGIAAVIIIIVSGFQYIISGGDSQKVANARTAIIGAAVGLAIIAVAESIIIFVVSKL